MKFTSILFFFLSIVLVSCSDKNNSDEPVANTNRLIGYWAITRIKTIEHIGGSHDTYDVDVPAHGIDTYMNDLNLRWDVLIFDEDFVTVRGDMPNCPKSSDYDMETPDGQIEYINDWNNWNNSIGEYMDKELCPVGTYSIKGDNLIIGSLNMGIIKFSSDNEFTLDYSKSLNGFGDYKRRIYTFSRIHSLTI